MRVNYSKLLYEEVRKKRAWALKNSVPSLKGLAEESVHYIVKRAPFLFLFLLYSDFVLDNNLLSVLGSVFKFFNEIFERKYQTWFANDISSLMVISLTLIVTGSIFAIILIMGFKIIFFAANKLLPRKTPICDRKSQILNFWRKSENIENVLKIMNEISELSADDIAQSEIMIENDSDKITMFLKDSKFGLIKKQIYSISHKPMMEKLRNSGELDFSFVDEEWDKLLCEYQVE